MFFSWILGRTLVFGGTPFRNIFVIEEFDFLRSFAPIAPLPLAELILRMDVPVY
jgi:hypothetical protein